MIRKKLLMLNATEHEIPFILAAKRLGFYVITTGNRPDFGGHEYGDEYVNADFSDYDAMIQLIKEKGIEAVSQGVSDNCALVAAFLGERFGWKGHDTVKNTEIIHRKDKFKEFAGKYNVRTPQSISCRSVDEAMDAVIGLNYPLIVKPVDLAGGKGVNVANNEKEYRVSVKKAFEASYAKNIVVEPFIIGTQHTLNTFLVNRKVRAFCTADDCSYLNKYLVNSGVSPASCEEEAVSILIPEIERIAEILGLVDGQLNTQYILGSDGPYFIEMMRRNIGNNWMGMIVDAIGVSWAEWCVRAEAGLDCSAMPASRKTNGYYGYHMIMGDHNGIFKRIEIDPQFQKYVYQFNQWKSEGYEIENYKMDKLGNILFHFDTLEEKEYYMPRINQLAKVVYLN